MFSLPRSPIQRALPTTPLRTPSPPVTPSPIQRNNNNKSSPSNGEDEEEEEETPLPRMIVALYYLRQTKDAIEELGRSESVGTCVLLDHEISQLRTRLKSMNWSSIFANQDKEDEKAQQHPTKRGDFSTLQDSVFDIVCDIVARQFLEWGRDTSEEREDDNTSSSSSSSNGYVRFPKSLRELLNSREWKITRCFQITTGSNVLIWREINKETGIPYDIQWDGFSNAIRHFIEERNEQETRFELSSSPQKQGREEEKEKQEEQQPSHQEKQDDNTTEEPWQPVRRRVGKKQRDALKKKRRS